MSGASVALRVASVATRADSGLPSEEQTSNTDIRARACPWGQCSRALPEVSTTAATVVHA